MRNKYYLFLCLVLIGNALNAGQIELFPEKFPFFSASALEFRHYLYFGSENNRFVNHGNIGVEFPIAGFSKSDTARSFLAGIAAATHLVMYPENMKFAVDNFYATLAVYAEAQRSPKLRFRLYPVYHVSGHLADGSPNDSALTHARAVSSEMVKVEAVVTPFRGIAFSAGYGYYYHVCVQQELTDRFDLALQWQPLRSRWFQPHFTLSGQFIHISQWRAGFDMEAGSRFVGRSGRGIGISFRYFNRMDPGYYFDMREKSAGAQVDFLL
jgi:hypothetical protein